MTTDTAPAAPATFSITIAGTAPPELETAISTLLYLACERGLERFQIIKSNPTDTGWYTTFDTRRIDVVVLPLVQETPQCSASS